MTVRELFSRMDSKEISEWRAYFKIVNEPKKEEKPDPEKVGMVVKNIFSNIGD